MNASKRYPISELERYIAQQLLEQNRATANPTIELPISQTDNQEPRKQK